VHFLFNKKKERKERERKKAKKFGFHFSHVSLLSKKKMHVIEQVRLPRLLCYLRVAEFQATLTAVSRTTVERPM
jgi:hypothetical protein